MKIDTRGTKALTDDRLVGGAAFDFRPDNGDGTYQPNGADASVSFRGVARDAFLVFAQPVGDAYWIVETHAPAGFETSSPTLVTRRAVQPDQNCIVYKERTRCFADDDGFGAFVLVLVTDQPAKLPPTDTVPNVNRSGRSEPTPSLPASVFCDAAVLGPTEPRKRACRHRHRGRSCRS